MQIKAFFFDLDGTLIDSEVIYVEAVSNALAERGWVLSRAEAVRLVYGRGWRDIFEEVTDRFPGAYRRIDEMEAVVRDQFNELRSVRNITIEGSVELLKRLSGKHPVAIVSGSPRQDIEAAIDLLSLEPFIQFYLGAEDYYPGKPAPNCYLEAGRRVGHPPESCLVFEDSWAGVEAAKAAGMRCVALRRNGALSQDVSNADQILADLGEFSLSHFEKSIA